MNIQLWTWPELVSALESAYKYAKIAWTWILKVLRPMALVGFILVWAGFVIPRISLTQHLLVVHVGGVFAVPLVFELWTALNQLWKGDSTHEYLLVQRFARRLFRSVITLLVLALAIPFCLKLIPAT